MTVSLDEDYPKHHTDHTAALGRLLAQAPHLDQRAREDLAGALNEIADKARDIVDIMSRLLEEGRTTTEIGELLVAFTLTTEQIRGQSDGLGGMLYEVADRLGNRERTDTVV